MAPLIVVLVMFGAGLLFVVTDYLPRKVRLRRFRGRSSLSIEELYRRFFSTLPENPTLELLHFINQNLGVPVGLIRPMDRFDRELARIECLEVVDDDLGYFWFATANRPRLKGIKDEILREAFAEAKTVGDYVRIIVVLEEESASRSDGS